MRINPDELHCNDPRFTDEIYASGGRIRDKWVHQLNTGAVGPVAVTGFSTVSHELHRVRRGAMNKYFSRQQMLKLEGEVLEFAQRVADKMLKFSGGPPFDIKQAFNCFTADVVSQYAFGESMGFVDQEGWEPNFATWVGSFFQQAYMMRHNTLARKLGAFAPMLADYMGEDVKTVMRQMTVVIPKYIRNAINDPDNGRVFADMVSSNVLPEGEKSMYRLSGEGFNFLLAGTETTGVSKPCVLQLFWTELILTTGNSDCHCVLLARTARNLLQAASSSGRSRPSQAKVDRLGTETLCLGCHSRGSPYDAWSLASVSKNSPRGGSDLHNERRKKAVDHTTRNTNRNDLHDQSLRP